MTEFVRVVRDVTLVGEIVLDPRYDPPWPGAGIQSVRKLPETVPAETIQRLNQLESGRDPR